MRTLLLMLGLLLTFCVCIAALYFVQQRNLIYFPQGNAFTPPGRVHLANDAGTLELLAVNQTAGPALLYFGGNAEDVSANAASFSATLPERAIYLMNYRGYGGSSGKPSQTALFADALAAFDHLAAQHTDIAVIGRSLGSAMACYLAAERPVSKLLLITPFDSMQALVKHHFPWLPLHWLLQDTYPSLHYAAEIRAPTLMLLASNDNITPLRNAQRLAAAFDPAQLQTRHFSAHGHNDIHLHPDYLPELQRFLQP